MKIYLCRHGQTTGDLEDRYGGDYDDHLTQLGIEQAQQLSDLLKDKGVQKIFVSPLIRARETAEIIGGKLNLVPEIVRDLKERNRNGILTGMVKSEAKDKFPDIVERLKDYKNTIEGAESQNDFQIRITEAIQTILKTNYETVAIVTHGGPMITILREIESASDYKIEDCGHAELKFDGEKMELIKLVGITKVD